ncbi:Endonuclease/exonuclease/phosphatase [Fimicolochytrium jonesii]|uniref:Endonuclease/exonuclease/phosphatase n=1 Tax=Fimicolochytrium jonesii TaxID=1396493 RepID=UPI0022FEEBD4|nr:Endonuclease/exonuclease/phosphatase [Fimicolochytrium jonesii]KAI8826160.1 Endonuclease/exonuclease/phosphatase [Fimicolochytrium jonesii]
MSFQDAIAALLRPTEVCSVSADLFYVSRNQQRKRRTLAVYRNIQGGDEAGVFLLKRRAGNTPAIYDMMPIYADFRLGVSQSKPVNLEEEGQTVTRARTGFTLRLSSGPKQMVLETASLETLQSVLVELKRLMAVAQQRGYVADGGTHNWMQHYERTRSSAAAALKQAELTGKAEQDRTQSNMANPFISFDSSVTGGSVKAIKEGWVAKELRARESRFVDFDSKRIFVGSWNVNGQAPSQPLKPWLGVSAEEEPSIYILGFQELDLNTGAYLYADTTKEDEWCKSIEQALRTKKTNYIKVTSKQLVGIFIVMYVSEAEKGFLREVSAEYLGTGLLGMMGNKGAAAIRFRFHDTYICCVNSHLAADASMVDRRNQDYQEICRRVVFPLPSLYDDFTAYAHANPWVASFYDARQSALATISEQAGKNIATIFDADHLFFFGDLNYRVSLPDTDVKAIINKGDVTQLLKFDQLLIEQRAKRAFQDFKEAPITFVPTFKYDIGTNTFDTSEKKRTPSFCDRILWFENPLHAEDPAWLTAKWYRSGMDMTLSDHKPIMGLFEAKVRKIDADKLTHVHEEILRELDKFENESLPDLAVSTNILEFGDIRYNVPVTKSITVENKGQVIAQYRFVPKPDEEHISRPWCYVNPPASMLLPGDQVKINVTILVDQHTAPALNSLQDTLDDILILHTENSKDHFMSVSANWLPSCFGTKIEALCKFIKPVREWSIAERKTVFLSPTVLGGAGDDGGFAESAGAANDDGLSPNPPVPDADNRYSIPYQLWRLIDFLFRYGMDVDNIFTSGGDPSIEEYIRECLDVGVEFDVPLLLLDPTTDPHDSVDDDPDDEDEHEDDTSTTGSRSRRPSAAGGSSGARTPADKRDSIHLDIEKLLKDIPGAKSDTLLGLASTANLSAATETVPLPRTHGRAVSVYSMAETLIKFLDSLEESVVPSSMSLRCTQEGYLTFVAARQTVQRLPNANYNVFKYIVRFLRAVVENYRGRGELDVERLADIFGPILLRLPTFTEGGDSGGLGMHHANASNVSVQSVSSLASTNPRTSSLVSSNVKYATTGRSQPVTGGRPMPGGGTGTAGLAHDSAAANLARVAAANVSTGSLSGRPGAQQQLGSSQEEVLNRKRRMFLMHFLEPENPDLP